MADRTEIQIALKADLLRSDLTQGLIWFVNYAALDPTSVKISDLDLHGAAMLPQDVEKFAHRWLAFSRSIDIEHDGIGRPVHVIESFFNSSDIGAPAWPINSHAVRFDVSASKEALDGLRSGALNSVSLDAYTFNKVVKLPVAQAKQATGLSNHMAAAPSSFAEWAGCIAQLGYEGVSSVDQVSPGVFVAHRAAGMPLAITIKDGLLEASAASGPWSHLAATLVESGTLTSSKKFFGIESEVKPGMANSGQPIDYAPWDPAAVASLLDGKGISEDSFAAVDPATSKMFLPHHIHHGEQVMLSKAGVITSLGMLSEIPEGMRNSARSHLLSHLDEITRREAGESLAAK